MTVLRNLVLIVMLGLTFIIVAVTLSSEEPVEEAARFLRILQSGDAHRAIKQFGDNTCGCQPRGGYLAFIKYESGEPDNLAFLFGRPFKIGEMTQRTVPTRVKYDGGNMPWEKPESSEVRVRILFDKRYSPCFLPLDTAFGHPIKEEDLKSFNTNPEPDFSRQIALRLRPGVERGIVAAPDKSSKREKFMADYYMELLEPQDTRYLRPLDAGPVLTAGGASVPMSRFGEQLPRLKETTVKLLVVRRGKFKHWQVKKGAVCDPVFELHNGKDIKLQGPDFELVPGSATR